MRPIFALAMLASCASARFHKWCYCASLIDGQWYNAVDLTAATCNLDTEARYFWTTDDYCHMYDDTLAGTHGHDHWNGQGIDGQDWEDACIKTAHDGFHKIDDPNGTPVKDFGTLKGICN